MQAVILAAGKGSRLKELTENKTKSMVQVNGQSMIERTLLILDKKNFERIIIVDGYNRKIFEDYINNLDIKTPILFIDNTNYDTTNNILSFQLTEKYWTQDTLFLESDLVFQPIIIDKILNVDYQATAAVAKYENWMDGTAVTLNAQHEIIDFIGKPDFNFDMVDSYYKTVNIYSFKKDFLCNIIRPILNNFLENKNYNEYYETIFKKIVKNGLDTLNIIDVSDHVWYEIDNKQDLNVAESLFEENPLEKLKKIQKRFGGYWRYPNMIDFCYIVNPFFPSINLLNEIKSNFNHLVMDYPSGQSINNLLAGEYFSINPKNIFVGNGAAELINALTETLHGKYGVIVPTFEEYSNRVGEDNIVRFSPKNSAYSYDVDMLIDFFVDKNIDNLILINPDNPSGNYIKQAELIRLTEWCGKQQINLIIDESFVDFADQEENPTLLDNCLLAKYSNLIVLKSISKSYGIPGLRLGVLATYNQMVITGISKRLSIWNINSMGEFFLQIIGKYKNEFLDALNSFYDIREQLKNDLETISYLRVIDSQANYFMCEVIGGIKATELVVNLLNDEDLFLKDLTNKNGITGEYIRVAIKRPEENAKLIKLLKKYEHSMK